MACTLHTNHRRAPGVRKKTIQPARRGERVIRRNRKKKKIIYILKKKKTVIIFFFLSPLRPASDRRVVYNVQGRHRSPRSGEAACISVV